MKAFKISVSVIVCLLLLAAMIYMNYGGFSTVRFQMIREGGETLVFRDIKGPYSITGDEISKINTDLENRFNIESLNEFGMYYDNPRMIAGNRLHSEAGCIIENTDTGKLMKAVVRLAIGKTSPRATRSRHSVHQVAGLSGSQMKRQSLTTRTLGSKAARARAAVDLAVPRSPRMSTPPMRGSTALSTRARRMRSWPTIAVNG